MWGVCLLCEKMWVPKEREAGEELQGSGKGFVFFSFFFLEMFNLISGLSEMNGTLQGKVWNF